MIKKLQKEAKTQLYGSGQISCQCLPNDSAAFSAILQPLATDNSWQDYSVG